MTRTPRTVALGIALLGLTATGCSGAAQSPTTDTTTPYAATPEPGATVPTTIRMAFVRGLADEQIGHFQDRLFERAGGSVIIGIPPDFSSETLSIEQDIVEAVMAGELDLGVVGARAFRELGIRDFDALIAPMAIDSMAAAARTGDTSGHAV